jgi:ferredoxin--NADP+ reductase
MGSLSHVFGLIKDSERRVEDRRILTNDQGRVTSLIETGKLFSDIDMPALDPANDRVMICGSPAMLSELSRMLDTRGFQISSHVGEPGDYVIERSFVAR